MTSATVSRRENLLRPARARDLHGCHYVGDRQVCVARAQLLTRDRAIGWLRRR